MKLNGLCRGEKRLLELATSARLIWLPDGLVRGALNAAKRVNLRGPGYHTIRSRNQVYGWTIRTQRSSSNSAIKHLVSGTSTTLWLYDEPKEVLDQLRESPELSNATLVGLVKDGKMGAADRLRLQLVGRGAEIKPHFIYEQAAIANLRWADMDQCLDHFTTWFSLVPDYDKSNPPTAPGPFKDIRHVLIHSGWPSARLPLILRFGMLCASKGYLEPVFHEILPLVVRFASANDGPRWMFEMEQAAVEYQSIHHPKEAEETARRYRTIAIDLCCQVGWLDHAMTIVRLERSFALPTQTYTLLIRALQSARRLDDVMKVEKYLAYDSSQALLLSPGETEPTPFPLTLHDRSKPATETTGEGGYPMSPPPPPTTLRSGATIDHALVLDDPYSYQEPTVSRQNVSKQLRTFKRLLRNSISPSPFSIVRFLSDFKTVGGSQRVVTWLRHRALSGNKYCNVAWMRAELRHHNVQRNYEQMLRLYFTYLNTTVPLPGIFRSTLTRIAAQKQFEFSPAGFPKYFPFDRWLVLKPIIRLVLDLPEPLATMRELYASYRTATKNVDTYNREPNEIMSTFIAAFGECGSPEDATRVLADCGNPPYLRQVETLAAVLARAGKVEQAMTLVRRIEAGAEDERKGMWVKGYDGKVQMAYPRLSTYGRVIEGFAEAGLLERALEVERMMKSQSLEYEYGQGSKLDEAMKLLWALEMERAGQV